MTIHDLGCSRKINRSFFLRIEINFLLDSVFTEFVSQPEMRAL